MKKSTLLTIFAIGGFIGTIVSAIKETPDAIILLEEKKREKGEYKLSVVETVITVVPAYWKTIALGGGTVGCMLGANALSLKAQASYISAYAMLDQSYKNYRKAVRKDYGIEEDRRLIAEAAEDVSITYDTAFGTEVGSLCPSEMRENSEEVLFYDLYSNRYFTAKPMAVLNAEYNICRNLEIEGCATVNEFYEFLGIPPIRNGDKIGWTIDQLVEDGLIWLDFSNYFARLEDGMECFIVSAFENPLPDIDY